jgi:hypothetical protein
VTDEHVCEFNLLPQVLPDFFLRRARTFDEVAADLNVGSVDDGDTGTMLLDQGNESGHLRVVDDDDVGATRGKGSTFREPVSIGIVTDPMVHLGLFFLGQAKVGIGNTYTGQPHLTGAITLEDIVIILGDAEDGGIRLGHVPTS